MAAFFDGRCTKCKRKVGWYGKLSDRPPCPSCGHVEVRNEADEKIIADFEDFLRQRMLSENVPGEQNVGSQQTDRSEDAGDGPATDSLHGEQSPH